jgi:hypothetical protein
MQDGDGWRVVGLDDIEQLSWRDTDLVWLPLRWALDTRIAGFGAYIAQHTGQTIVEPHTESGDGRGHEELYVVLRGAVEFRLGESQLEVSAGGFVLIRDPSVRRSAVALVPDTAVLAIGDEPRFEPAIGEWIERARAYASTEPARAWAVVDELRLEHSPNPGVDIAEAIVATRCGESDRARAALARLLLERPALSADLARDPDLGPLLA